MNVDTSHLDKEISELRELIAASPYSLEEGETAGARIKLALDRNNEEDAEWLKSEDGKLAFVKIETSNAHHQIANYERTLALPLMKIDTRYVVTNTPDLESPAGFHPDTMVFVQTTIAIHTDTLAGLPSSNDPLYAHDMEAVR